MLLFCLSSQVLYSYGIGFVYILIGLVFSGELEPAFRFCAQVRMHEINIPDVCLVFKSVSSSHHMWKLAFTKVYKTQHLHHCIQTLTLCVT